MRVIIINSSSYKQKNINKVLNNNTSEYTLIKPKKNTHQWPTYTDLETCPKIIGIKTDEGLHKTIIRSVIAFHS